MKTDSQIKKDVLDELAWRPNIDETEIGVIVKDGVVTLSGIVNDFSKKVAAEKAAKNVAGVKAVAEDIKVIYGDAFKKTDTEIAKAAVNALEWNASVPKDKVNIKVEDGYIYLSGNLPWEYQKNAAQRAVQYLIGVIGVVNNIRLEQMVKPLEVRDRISQAFERAANIDANNVKVEAEGHTVKLSGTVGSIKEKEDAEKAAFNAPGVSKVENNLKVQFYPTYA
tara:strand:- start:371 stop:1039 length:669 start_codon:yes stop_codon:yes gene_type:complete